jgi:hypothetical protein
MTHDRSAPDPEPELPEQSAIDALLDGEPVDKHALRHVLNDSQAREYFVDALVLRQLTHDMGPSGFVASATRRGPLARRMRWLAAAAVAMTSAAGGYVYGQRAPEPDGSATAVEITLENTPPAAPAPTRVIRLEAGVNWSTKDGGR